MESDQPMKSKNLLLIAALLVFALAAYADEKKVLQIEVRSAKTVGFDAATYMAFGTDDIIEFDALSSMKQREDGGFTVFQNSHSLHSGDQRHAIIIYVNRKPRNQPEQVFLLPIPRMPEPMDWTNWQHPNYVETNAVSNFRFNYIPPDRSTNVLSSSFELRYKVE